MRLYAKKKLMIKIVKILFILGIVGMITLLSINFYVKNTVKDQILLSKEVQELEKVDCILVLGAGVWSDGRPSQMLEDRLKEGISIYESGVCNRLLMSGDHGRVEYDEVNVMKQYAIDAGIPSTDIFMDHAGFSTYESLYRARDVFKTKKIIIVTQGYHLYRALYIADQLGLEAYGVASDPRQYSGQNYRTVREILARVKDFFNVLIQPEPTYLGEAIPVSGNGNITND